MEIKYIKPNLKIELQFTIIVLHLNCNYNFFLITSDMCSTRVLILR